MSHAYHENLPGFHPAQILRDGCAECEQRGRDVAVALSHLDDERFARAWLRAADAFASRPPSGREAEAVSQAEYPLLRCLWNVQLLLHRTSGLPYGTLPGEPPPLRVVIPPTAAVGGIQERDEDVVLHATSSVQYDEGEQQNVTLIEPQVPPGEAQS